MMAARSLARPRKIEQLGAKIVLLWAGLSIGVAFLATPAKFLALSLTLPVALDVGRHTFRMYNSVELLLLVGLLVLGRWSTVRRRWYLALIAPAAVVLAQRFWLIPALDLRTLAIQHGQSPLPPSQLHTLYIGAEALKVVWLLALGLGDRFASPGDPFASRRGAAPTARAGGRS
jgi:hypothetical protein